MPLHPGSVAGRRPGSGVALEGSILESVPLQVLGLPARTERIFVRNLIYDGALGATFMEQGIFMFDLRGNQPWIGLQPGA